MVGKPTQEQFIDKLKEVHGGTIITNDKYINSRTKLEFICTTCGNRWRTTPSSVLTGNKTGCPRCANNKIHREQTKSQKQFLKDLRKEHGVKITTKDSYKGANKYMIFHCNRGLDHPDWKAKPNYILCGRGCPSCAKNCKVTTKQIAKRIENKYGTRFSVIGEYKTNSNQICLRCNACGLIFKTIYSNILRTRGCGCPNCASSSGEQTVSSILEFNDINYDPQHSFSIKGKTHRLDFILKDAKSNWCVIQPDGEQHFKPNNHMGGEKEFEHRKQMDKDENKYLSALGVRVLRIPWFWFDLDSILSLMKDFLGYNLEKPDKDYIPRYKRVQDMIHDYLVSGSAIQVSEKYHTTRGTVYKYFKDYFGVNRTEYVKVYPKYATKRVVRSHTVKVTYKGSKKVWSSLKEASNDTGVGYTLISACLHGKQKTAGGYKWEYAE